MNVDVGLGGDLGGALWIRAMSGPASYAAVPHLLRVHRARNLADWNTYGIVGAIEQAGAVERNPPHSREG